MPSLAAFPKAYIDQMVNTGEVTLAQWIEWAATLDIDGLEFYSGFPELQDRARWAEIKESLDNHALSMPMLCCSPDFTHPDTAVRNREIQRELEWIEMTAALGGKYTRVLSGQRRPEVSVEQGLDWVTAAIQTCLPRAEQFGITLTLENHYKDDFWEYPEFAQKADVFCQLLERIDSPHFGVNFDPSNALLAGEDPLELLERVKDRVVTMHASDRYLEEGTLEDLRREENVTGYAKRLKHGVIGEGLNDYDAIFGMLSECGFNGWISIEDGMNGLEDLRASIAFLRGMIRKYWGDAGVA